MKAVKPQKEGSPWLTKGDYTLLAILLASLWAQEPGGLRLVLEHLLDTLMLAEREEHLQAAPYQRTPKRRDHANGFKPKTIETRLGPLALRVPQARYKPLGWFSVTAAVPNLHGIAKKKPHPLATFA